MGKRVNRVQFHLDTGSVKQLSAEEIAAILRAADELIDSGGRTMLVKILKGSRDKKLLELGLDQCPAYGFYNKMTMTEIGFRVDWMIRNEYLKIEYNYRLPVLVFSKTGWEIEKRTYAQELYDQLCKAAGDNDEQFIVKLKEHTNRQVIWIILDLIKGYGSFHSEVEGSRGQKNPRGHRQVYSIDLGEELSQPQSESYTAAKGGIAALTHALAVSLSGRVRVNSISPGWTRAGRGQKAAWPLLPH